MDGSISSAAPWVAIVLAPCLGVAGWFLKRLNEKVEAQETARIEAVNAVEKRLMLEISAGRDAFANYKIHVAEHYVTQSELTKAVESLDRTMQRLLEAVNQNAKETREGFSEIHRRIDGKADKT